MGGGSAGEKMAGIASRRLFIHRLTFWTDRLGFLSVVRDRMRMSEIGIPQVKLNRLYPFLWEVWQIFSIKSSVFDAEECGISPWNAHNSALVIESGNRRVGDIKIIGIPIGMMNFQSR